MRLLLLVLILAFAMRPASGHANGGDLYDVINFSIEWTGGVPPPACNSCIGASFACSDGRGAWNSGVLNFMDPFQGPVNGKTFLPIAINLTITGFFNCDNSTSARQMLLALQGSLIGPPSLVSLPQLPMGCNCPNCQSTAYTLSLYQAWPGGVNDYQVGGLNEFHLLLLQPSNGTSNVCLQTFNVTMTYADVAMTLTEISPPLGLVTGGTPVQVFGTYFPVANLFCSFGNVLVPAQSSSMYSCSCTAPAANVSGEVAFRLMSGNLASRNPLVFQYYNAPTVTSISPSSCLADKTVLVTLTGTDFPNSNYTQVSFNGAERMAAASQVVWISPNTLRCITPPFAQAHWLPGFVGDDVGDDDDGYSTNVTVEVTFDGYFYFGNLTFTFIAPPANATHQPVLTYVVWAATGCALVLLVIFIVVLITRAYCGCGYAEYEVRPRDEESLWNNADIKQISPAEIVLGERIGKGSFGQVFRGTWHGTQVAVKKLHMPMLVDDAFVREFKNEIDVMRRVSHPNCLQFLGASLIPPDIVIVTEYMSRGSLYKILHSGQPLSWEQRRGIVLDTCRGMCYLHGSNPVIIHRDLKSHNLLLDENWRTKVCDFGLSKVLVETGSAAQLTACGTPCWTAPEVIKNQLYTTKADVYSFGIVLWELITRDDPFKGMPPFQVVFAVGTRGLRPPIPADCPPFWAELMRRCWSENADERPTFEVILERVEGMP